MVSVSASVTYITSIVSTGWVMETVNLYCIKALYWYLPVSGESVEENANLVVRLLIRRPECLGPALRGEGGGLLKAMKDGILMSLQIAASRDDENLRFLKAVTEVEGDDRGNYLIQK